MLSLLFVLIAYCIGSICSAVIVSKLFQLPDPRLEGSKNPGATNVLRLAGTKYAIIVLIVDMLKGTLPVLLAALCHLTPFALGFVCLAAVLGHIYPIFFNFQGGKGVATALGVLLGFCPMLGFWVVISWITTAVITRISSLSSIVALTLAPIFALFSSYGRSAFLPLLMISILVIYQHYENILRLMDGTEAKINFKKK